MRRNMFLIIILLVMMMPIAARAQHGYEFYYSNNGGIKTFFTTVSGTNIGYDREYQWQPGDFRDNDIGVAIYKINGRDGWDGNTGFYVMDYRPPMNAGETVVIRDICLWAGPTASATNLQLYQQFQPIMSLGLTYKLRLTQIPVGITYTGPTEWESDHGTIILPFYATDNPLTGYRFQATITAPVPEPSSLLALAGGLAGLGGFVLKRRR